MNQLKPTTVTAVSVAFVAAALIGWVTAVGFYGYLPPLRVSASVCLFLMAMGCVIAGWVVRKKISAGQVGQDRSQLSPLTVAQMAVTGRSVAWIGAVIGGAYAGVAVYVLLNSAHLLAASHDVPGVLAGTVGGLLSVGGGMWLERGCVVPPTDPSRNLVAGSA